MIMSDFKLVLIMLNGEFVKEDPIDIPENLSKKIAESLMEFEQMSEKESYIVNFNHELSENDLKDNWFDKWSLLIGTIKLVITRRSYGVIIRVSNDSAIFDIIKK